MKANRVFPIRWKVQWPAILFVALILAMLVWKITAIGHFRWYQDEGEYVSSAWLLLDGHKLYSDVFIPSPPLFIHSLALGLGLLGKSLYSARFIIAVYALIGIVAAGLAAREFRGWPAAFAAAALLSWNTEYFRLSRIAMSDLPGSALLMLSLLFLLYYCRSRSRIWLFLSGLIKGIAILVKLVSLPLLPVFGLAIVLLWWVECRDRPAAVRWKGMITDGLIWAGAFLLPLVIGSLYYDPALLWESVFTFHWEAKSYYVLDVGRRLEKLWQFTSLDLGAVGLAVFGIYCLFGKRDWRIIIPIGGLIVMMVSLFFHVPLSLHHLLPIAPFLALLAGVGFARIFNAWVCLIRKKQPPIGLPGLILGSALIIFAVAQLPTVVETNYRNRLSTETVRQMETDAMYFIESTTQPGDFVISDDPLLVLLSGRNVFPELVGVDSKRIKSGLLTGARLIELAKSNDYPVVVFWRDLFEQLDDFATWVAAHYESLEMVEHHRIYVPRDHPFPQPQRLVDGIDLIYAHAQTPANLSGEQVSCALFWRCQSAQTEDYLLLLRLVNGVQRVFGRQIGRPHGGNLPTTTWYAGDLIYDPREVKIMPGTPAGSYRLLLEALRQDESGDWQPVGDSEIELAIVEVSQRPPPSIKDLDMENEMYVQLESRVELLGYSLEGETRPGSEILLTLFWKALTGKRENYVVFTHLIGPDGNIWGQKDNVPVDGFHPANLWYKGEIVRDRYDISIPPNAPEGEYQLRVGMYLPDTNHRLLVERDGVTTQADSVLLDRMIVISQ